MTSPKPRRSRLESFVTRVFDDAESASFGSGWMSGTAGVFLGALAVAGVLVFRFPGVLSTADFRNLYPLPFLRALLNVVIGASFRVSPVDKSFAVHVPWLDWLFGAQHLPADEWPDHYGIRGGPVPEGWMRQQMYPFCRQPERPGKD